MTEVEAIKAVSDALQKLQPDEQARVLSWACAKFGSPAPILHAPQPEPKGDSMKPSGITTPKAATAPAGGKNKGSKKSKTIISMDKTLNLMPPGKDSAATFAAAKAPSNVKEKCVVAVFYLRDFMELEKVTPQGVFTFFKTVQWPVPADLKNTLQQAGTEGWLDTADSDDIKLTSLGENVVEHSLPKKPKS